jgi:integrase
MPRKKNSRAPSGAGNIRKRADGRWEGSYSLGSDPVTGKRVRRSIYGASEKEVLEKLQKINVEISSGEYVEPVKMTLSSWLDIWISEYSGHLKPSTKVSYQGKLDYRIKPALGSLRLSEIKAHEIQRFYNTLINTHGLSPKTAKNIHGILHKALSQAEELGYIKKNPASVCKLPRIEKAKIKPLDERGTTNFLQAIQGHPYETLFLVALFTGARQSEIIGLTWDCVDFEKGTILLYRQLQKIDGTFQFISLKNNKSRTISPAPSVMKALQEHRRTQAAQRLKTGSAWKNLDFVFTNALGENLTQSMAYEAFKKIMAGIGLPNTRFHDLRHSYAVAALQSGDDIKTVQENLGHHTAAFTLDTYGHVTEKMKQESANRMERYYQSLKGGI